MGSSFRCLFFRFFPIIILRLTIHLNVMTELRHSTLNPSSKWKCVWIWPFFFLLFLLLFTCFFFVWFLLWCGECVFGYLVFVLLMQTDLFARWNPKIVGHWWFIGHCQNAQDLNGLWMWRILEWKKKRTGLAQWIADIFGSSRITVVDAFRCFYFLFLFSVSFLAWPKTIYTCLNKPRWISFSVENIRSRKR